MKTKLSERIRPNSEAAPWVIQEVKQMEQQIEQLREQRDGLLDHLKLWLPVLPRQPGMMLYEEDSAARAAIAQVEGQWII